VGSVTIKMIAKLARVSTATVSRVVNHRPTVGLEVKRRVEAAIKSTGYRPSLVARSLATKRTDIFAFVYAASYSNLFYPELLRGVQDEANGLGYQVIVCNTGGLPERETQFLDTVEQLRVAGVIFGSVLLDHPESVVRVQGAGIPCILLNRRLATPAVDYVVVDNVRGACAAIEHLIGLGHRRVGFIGGPDNTSNGRERLEGYEMALRRHGVPLEESLVKKTNNDQPDAYRRARELLALAQRPTAIFVQNDFLCIRVFDAILEMGLRVPEDVALVSFDATSIAESRALSFTTVSQRTYEMGRRAVQILALKAQHPDIRERFQVVFETELLIRASSGGPVCEAERPRQRRARAKKGMEAAWRVKAARARSVVTRTGHSA
jgi:DNA-binding LacI/PurR family transcriptional regulator